MKKITKLLANVGIVFSILATYVPVHAGELDIKLGAASQKTAGDRVGFNAGIGYNHAIDKYFVINPEIGLNWHKFDKGTGTQVTFSTGQTGELVNKNNSFLVPVLLNAKILIPTGNDEWGGSSLFTPYLGIGAGWAWMFNTVETPEYQGTMADKKQSTLNGLMYQVFGGFAFKVAQDSNVQFLLEGGYRGGEVELNNARLNVGGFFANGGVKIALDLGQSKSW